MIVRCNACGKQMLVENPAETVAVACPHCRAEVRVSSPVLLDDHDAAAVPTPAAEPDVVELVPVEEEAPQTLDSLAALTSAPGVRTRLLPAPRRIYASASHTPSSRHARAAPACGLGNPRRTYPREPHVGKVSHSRKTSTRAPWSRPPEHREASTLVASRVDRRRRALLLGAILLIVLLALGYNKPHKPGPGEGDDRPVNIPDNFFPNVKGQKQ